MVDFMHKDKNWDKNYGENFKNYHTFLFIWYIISIKFDLSDNMYILRANNYVTLMCFPIIKFSTPNKISFGIESLFPKSKCS